MQIAHFFEFIRVQRAVIRVVGVRGNERLTARKADHHGRVVKVAVRPAQLNDIAYFYFVRAHLFGKGSRAGRVAS